MRGRHRKPKSQGPYRGHHREGHPLVLAARRHAAMIRAMETTATNARRAAERLVMLTASALSFEEGLKRVADLVGPYSAPVIKPGDYPPGGERPFA